MTWLVTAVGTLVVGLVLRDIFHTLGRPGVQGRLSRSVLGAAWRVTRGRKQADLAGPLAMLAVIGSWGVLAVLGWALIYLPHLPGGFTFATEHQRAGSEALLDALYISLVTISTLGLGDAVPASGWLRVVNPLEALFGFALLTVAVSWVLQIYPALTRRRVLAIRLSLIARAGVLEQDGQLAFGVPAILLHQLADDIVGVRVDLSEYVETYYFRENTPDASFAATVGIAAALAHAGTSSGQGDIRLAAGLLQASLDDLAQMLDAKFLHHGGSTSEIIAAYATDHGHPDL